jgi:hypothetical protein
MKNMTIAEFETLASCGDWNRKQDIEIIETQDRTVEDYDDTDGLVLTAIPHTFGVANKFSTLDGITIGYTENFKFDDHQADTFAASPEGLDEVWTAEGVIVIDEDGDELNAHELAEYLNPDFQSIDYTQLIDDMNANTDIDIDEDSDMGTIILEIDNAPSLRFTGAEIGCAASSENNASSVYSGTAGRWAELTLYKTQGGKLICHQIGRTIVGSERNRFSGAVCETVDEVKGFFGHRWLAKELYESAGIEDVTEVD